MLSLNHIIAHISDVRFNGMSESHSRYGDRGYRLLHALVIGRPIASLTGMYMFINIDMVVSNANGLSEKLLKAQEWVRALTEQ
jgi:hypothetical protein